MHVYWKPLAIIEAHLLCDLLYLQERGGGG